MKNQNGITLIALVITIIVLLILAGISIAMLTGDNGLLTKSRTAVMDNAIAGVKDDISTEVQAAMAIYLENKYANNDTTTKAVDTIKTELEKIAKYKDITTTSGKEVNGCTVKFAVNAADNTATITITKETRKVVGTIATDGSLTWDAITNAA